MQEQKSLDEQLWSAIHAVESKQNIDEMKRLLDAGATLTYYDAGYTAFHDTVLSSKLRSILGEYMLKKKPYIMIDGKSFSTIETPIRNKKFYGYTLLQETILDAAKYDSVCADIVEFLTAHGANTEVLFDNKPGHTPLYVAAIQGSIKVAEALIKGGAKLEVRDENGNTPLLAALMHGKVELAEMLIKAGAKVDVANNANVTPLNLAAEQGCPGIVGLLISPESNINGNITDNEKNTALDIALKFGHLGIAIIVIKYGLSIIDRAKKTINDSLQFSEESRARFKKYGSQLLFLGVSMNDLAVVKYCFDVAKKIGISLDTSVTDSNGVDVYTFCALKHRNIEIFRQIIKNESKEKLASFHPSLGLGGLAAIHFAAAIGDRETIKYLVNEMKVSINVLAQNDTLHVTPLDAARNLLQPSNPDFVHFLESFGAISGVDEQKLVVLTAYNQKKGEALKQYATEIRKAIDLELNQLNSSESVSTSSSGSSSPEGSPKKSSRETRSASYTANQHGTLFQHKESALVVPANSAKKVKSRRGCEVM